MTTTPDPRPHLLDQGELGVTISGNCCVTCDLKTLSQAESCPACGGGVVPASFGPQGTVWSSTVVRVPVPGRQPPYAIAYVDIVDGPRVLCHLAGASERAAVGARVHLTGLTNEGDLCAEVAA